MKYAILFLLILSPSLARAQTVVGASQSYFMTYYDDSYYNDSSYAISELGIPSFETLSFQVKIKSATRASYSDSQGSRFSCVNKPTYTKCSFKGNYIDESDGTNCIESYAYYFTIQKQNRINAIFQEAYQCDDGWYRNIEYRGRTTYKVKKWLQAINKPTKISRLQILLID